MEFFIRQAFPEWSHKSVTSHEFHTWWINWVLFPTLIGMQSFCFRSLHYSFFDEPYKVLHKALGGLSLINPFSRWGSKYHWRWIFIAFSRTSGSHLMVAKCNFMVFYFFLGLSYKMYCVLVECETLLFYDLNINQIKSWNTHFVEENSTNRGT